MIQRILFVMLVCLALISVSVKGLRTERKEGAEKAIPVPNKIATVNDEKYNKLLSSIPFWKRFESEMAQPSPEYIPPTAEEKIKAEKKRQKKINQFAKIKADIKSGKLKEIPMRFKPITVKSTKPPGGMISKETVCNLGDNYHIILVEVKATCSPCIQVLWSLYLSSDKKSWVYIADGNNLGGVPCDNEYQIGKVNTTTARYARWKVEINGLEPAGDYTMTLYSARLFGVKQKPF